jgi:hypothetical protein
MVFTLGSKVGEWLLQPYVWVHHQGSGHDKKNRLGMKPRHLLIQTQCMGECDKASPNPFKSIFILGVQSPKMFQIFESRFRIFFLDSLQTMKRFRRILY